MLGGGGFTGGVYEIGALRAIDLLATNRTVNEFDVYVGTSAGAFVTSLLANGVTPEEMMRVLNHELQSPLRDIDLRTLLRPNYRGFADAGGEAAVQARSASRARSSSHLGEVSAVDVATGLASRAAARACTRAAASSATSPRCSPTPIAPTTSGSSTASSI